MQRRPNLISFLLVGTLLLFLNGCAPVVTYADLRQTAQAGGCWPNRPAMPTPAPVTVTPLVPLTPTPIGWQHPTGEPVPTPFPTTTPYPRCAPAPGEILAPWPTPIPPPPPYPTMQTNRAGGGSGRKTTLHLPEMVLTTDVAVHPTEGWPAVAAAVWSGNDNPERAFVSVQHPQTRTWSPAHQVDIGDSALGRYTRTVEVAISGDGIVHAVWGMSDPDFTDNEPPAGVWTAFSTDYGMSWSQPEQIGRDCRQVNELAATVQGWLVAGLICNARDDNVQPAIAVRNPDGTWHLDRLPGAVWYFSDGAVAISGDGDDAQATVIALSGPNGAMSLPRILFFQKRLARDEPWRISHRDVILPGLTIGARAWHARALVYRPVSATNDFITFMWSDATEGHVFAITSPDGGASWLPVEHVASPPNGGETIAFATPAYDPRSDRLLAIFTCCEEAGWGDSVAATHYLRQSMPGSGVWQGSGTEQVPLLLGARSAGETVAAQAVNAGQSWIAWIEGGNTVEVRAFDFTTALPGGQ